MDEEKLTAELALVRDQVRALATSQESRLHDGKPCPRCRAVILAYLAISLDFNGDMWGEAEDKAEILCELAKGNHVSTEKALGMSDCMNGKKKPGKGE